MFQSENLPAPADPAAWIRDNIASADGFYLQQQYTSTDKAGNEHKKFRQWYKGFLVEGAVVNLHCKSGVPHAMNGEFYPLLAIDPKINIKESKALDIALEQFPGATFAWQQAAWERMLFKTSKGKEKTYFPEAQIVILPLAEKDTVTFRLAYKFNVYAVRPLARKLVYIDAEDGKVLETLDLLQDMDTKGKAHTKYSGEQSITCDESVVYTLQESCRGNGIATFNAGLLFAGGDPVLFEDDDNVWNNVNAAQDEIATDLHWGMEKTYDFYKEVLGRNSTDNKGYNLIALGHVQPVAGEKFANAMWDGHYAFFGDGDDTSMHPFASVDIVGHEISHGLIQETACLQYKNESGALNESFADILGKCVEHYTSPATFSWEFGKKIMWDRKPAMRNMKSPNAVNQPKFYNGKYFHTGPSDNGGVHCNSALQNYWFSLLCDGGAGFRESDVQPFVVKPIGWDKAIKVVYLNLSSYLTPRSEYKDAALGSVQAAKALFGDTSPEAYTVQMAWYAIGVLDKPEKKEPTAVSGIAAAEQELSVFPNPASSMISIVSGRPLQQAQLKVFNPSGRLIEHKDRLEGALHTVDIAAYAPGLYFVEIAEPDRVSRTKFVKL
ncbi:MAG TPA: M4 family metallopeptidase [Chitinophagaceae bacterium]|nr:M4 family metallopeptidase [Chitinophagaceae bacterium]